MRELVVISGKGGTGKTSVAASFASLARNAVVADCDVDAPDLYLVLSPDVKKRNRFRSGSEAKIIAERCDRCGRCFEVCRFDAIRETAETVGSVSYAVDPLACEGCGVCVRACPKRAISFDEQDRGEWMISETRHGPMVHARLKPGAENSGKLVSTVRREAKAIAEDRGLSLIIVDGPPGIGCPVIASIGGADEVLLVAEPSLAAEHDLVRAIALCRHFGVSASVCVNKYDLSIEMTGHIERLARESGAAYLGGIPFDPAVSEAQIEARTVVESGGPAAEAIESIWHTISQIGA
jgi:MinD superfamily P-loop ATPase